MGEMIPCLLPFFQMGLHQQLDDHVENMFVELLPLPDFSLFFFFLYEHVCLLIYKYIYNADISISVLDKGACERAREQSSLFT